jgi:hypothetical protein
MMAHAENLADGRGTISAKIAGHIAACDVCATELHRIQSTLNLLAKAPELMLSRRLTAHILIAAQRERALTRSRSSRRKTAVALLKGLSYAACLAITIGLYFETILNPQLPETVTQAAPTASTQVEMAMSSPQALRKATTEVHILAEALNGRPENPEDVQALRYRRAAIILAADIQAGQAALERNPNCIRASRMVNSNLERQAQTLKALYVERSL